MMLGASSSTTAHFLKLICFPPSIFTDLSKDSYGEIVFAFMFRAIIPSAPFLGNSELSPAISISSCARSGLAITIDLKFPTSLVGLNVT